MDFSVWIHGWKKRKFSISIHEIGFKNLDLRIWILEIWIHEFGFKNLDSRNLVQECGFKPLVFRIWIWFQFSWLFSFLPFYLFLVGVDIRYRSRPRSHITVMITTMTIITIMIIVELSRTVAARVPGSYTCQYSSTHAAHDAIALHTLRTCMKQPTATNGKQYTATNRKRYAHVATNRNSNSNQPQQQAVHTCQIRAGNKQKAHRLQTTVYRLPHTEQYKHIEHRPQILRRV